jgi:hypothetical protein
MPTAFPILKSVIQKNIQVRAVCVLREGQHIDERLRSEGFLEFRRITTLFNLASSNDIITDAFRSIILGILSKKACLTIVDDQEAFIFFPDVNDASRSIGLTLKLPGLPMMQRILFEHIVQHGTVRLK